MKGGSIEVEGLILVHLRDDGGKDAGPFGESGHG